MRRLGRQAAIRAAAAIAVACTTLLWLVPRTTHVAAQQQRGGRGPAQQQSGTLQVFSRLTVVDVTASDSTGQPVHGLQRSDFTILDNGKPQAVRNFEEVRADWVEPPRELPPNIYTNVQPKAPSPAVNILLLDFANTAPINNTEVGQVATATATQKRMKDAAIQAVQNMPVGTRVEVIAMSRSLRIVQSFTSDRAILAAAINALPYDLDGNGDTQCMESNNRNRLVLEVLDRIAADSAAVKVRKNLIWFTIGIPQITDPAQRKQCQDDYSRGLSDAYNLLTAAQVSIYPVDVAGIGLGARQLSMEAVAEATGGIAYVNTNDMGKAVLSALSNGANYYSIAYTPPITNTKYDGAYHKIVVKVNKPGIKLVFRDGYYNDDPAKMKMPQGLTFSLAPPAAIGGDMKASMSRGLPTSSDLLFEVGVEPSTLAPKPGDPPVLGTLSPKLQGKPLQRYGFQYVVPAEQLKFSPGPNNTHLGKVDYNIAVFDTSDQLLTGLSQTQTMSLTDTTYKQMLQNHSPLRFYQQIDLPQQGQMFLRVGILDHATNRTGTLELPLALKK